ncbi:hypothetical protein, conserved [Babesia ovata]|uniref:Extracellular matrix-binding ebh n=1 Tax=Babesia ovata TaxID=189622 RepID=A0A2H6KAH6_9APIC|nr:uncharacterized protein BOVATA_014790 [Babesia ovata]GBE59986.1 hypothetical protein, conserved [Babesia ovata]
MIDGKIEELKSKIGKGHGVSGFAKAIGRVRDGLERYEDEMKSLNDAVIGHSESTIEQLKHQIDDNIEAIGKFTEVDQYDEYVRTWHGTVTQGLDENVTEIQKAIKKLDEPLRKLLKNDFEKIKQEVSTIRKSAKRDEFHMRGLGDHVTKKLNRLRENVDKRVTDHMRELKNKLAKNIRAMQRQVSDVYSKLGGYVKELQKWIDTAKEIVDAAVTKVESILNVVKHDTMDKSDQHRGVTDAAEQLKQHAEELYGAGKAVHGGIVKWVSDATKQIPCLEKVYKEKLVAVRDAVRATMSRVEDKIKAICQPIGAVRNTVEDFVSKITEQIVEESKNALHGGSNHVVNKYHQYVDDYIKNFDRSVDRWVQDAVQNSGLPSIIYLHVTGANVNPDWKKISAATKNGMQKISQMVKGAGQKPIAAEGDVKTTLNNIKAFFDKVPSEVQPAKASEIVAAINQNQDSSISPSAYTLELENAVKAVLASISSKASAASEDIKTLTAEQNISEIKKSLTNPSTLVAKLGKVEAKAVDDALQKVTDKPLKGIDKSNEGVITISDINYYGYDLAERSLRSAISNVDSQVRKALSKIEKLKENALQKHQEVGERLNALCTAVEQVAGKPYNEGTLKKLLNDFKTTKIATALNKIRKQFSELQSESIVQLNQAVNTLLSDTLPKLAASTIEETNKYLGKQVESAIKDIKNLALKRYALSKTGELTELNNFVDARRLAMTKIIDEDKASGIKGLLGNMKNGIEQFEDFDTDLELHVAASHVSDYLKQFMDAVKGQPDTKSVASNFDKLHRPLEKLLDDFETSQYFDNTFCNNVKSLNDAVESLVPERFSGPISQPLDVLKDGVKAFAGEVGKAYINAYEGCQPIDQWVTQSAEQNAGQNGNQMDNQKEKLTDDGKCGAKVCLTIFNTIYEYVTNLKYECESHWQGKKLCKSDANGKNFLGLFLQQCGFDIAKDDNSKEGESQCRVSMTAENIITKLSQFTVSIASRSNSSPLIETITDIFAHLETYNRVCHYTILNSPRYPCSVFDMLSWLCSLQYNTYYDKLRNQCNALIKDEKDGAHKKIISALASFHLPAMFTPTYHLLLTIAGYGDASTYYGCDYLSNTLGLYYPSNTNGCFDMLHDILSRLCPVLTFLLSQCRLDKSCFGWADCKFGNGVQTSDWQCGPHGGELPSSNGDCCISSPLHSYLTDALRGMLPHTVTSIKGKPVCSTCSKSTGNMPCLTPLGFRSFSGSTRRGRDLCSLLDDICSNSGVLTKVYSHMSSIVSLPPRTLPDVFSFQCRLPRYWHKMDQASAKLDPIQQAICDKVTQTVACDIDDAKKLLNPCLELYNSKSHKSHNFNEHPDLKYLLGCGENNCGNYLRPLNRSAYYTLTPKHADKHLAWLVHVTEQTVTLLTKLVEELLSISCHDYGCQGCHHEDKCIPNKHGRQECGCESVVHCQAVLPVLYKYGFTYGNVRHLAIMKTCNDLVEHLEQVKKSKHMEAWLKAIDNFIWAIRTPFSYLLLALWSLSLLYLLHIAVVRLDVLRIRSHLRSPSSHRIAAQSLLAAARVKALANVKYFSP